MKKILVLVLGCMMILSLAACGHNSDINENNTSKSNSTEEATSEGNTVIMNITIENTTFTATLQNNDTAKAFVSQLPLTIDMYEINGNEKYSNLSSSLSADTSFSPDIINEGDLMLYGSNTLVLFYKTFNTSYSYVKLGHINDTTGLAKALGSGNVKVTFSIL